MGSIRRDVTSEMFAVVNQPRDSLRFSTVVSHTCGGSAEMHVVECSPIQLPDHVSSPSALFMCRPSFVCRANLHFPFGTPSFLEADTSALHTLSGQQYVVRSHALHVWISRMRVGDSAAAKTSKICRRRRRVDELDVQLRDEDLSLAVGSVEKCMSALWLAGNDLNKTAGPS